MFLTFLKIGFFAFGGPVAHIALFEDTFVKEKKILTHDEFLNYIGLTNLIPGPNSTEMAMMIGYHDRGIKGLVFAGLGFILPSLILTTVIGYLYMEFGDLEGLNDGLIFLRPIVVAIIVQALFKLSKKVEFNVIALITAFVAAACFAFDISIILAVVFSGAIFVILSKLKTRGSFFSLFPIPVFTTFFYIGSILVGSGYVLIAYLQELVVVNQGWITEQQLLDAVAIGQLTPGPVLGTASVVGLFGFGLPGAVAAGLGIFLPSFLLTIGLTFVEKKIRHIHTIQLFLKGAVIGSLVAMATVSIQLLLQLSSPMPYGMFLFSLLVLVWLKVKPLHLIGGALVTVTLVGFLS